MKRRQEFYQKHPYRGKYYIAYTFFIIYVLYYVLMYSNFYLVFLFADMHLHPEFRGISVDRLVYTAEELISLSLEYYDKYVYILINQQIDKIN